jgi:N utilization substance protein A
MKSDFIVALTQLASERNLPREIVVSAIEDALLSAYKGDSVAANQDISVKLDPGSGQITVFILKTVVENPENNQQISLEQAREIKADAEIGEMIPTDSLVQNAGRIAAQTAKQVVLQRLREAELELVLKEYTDKEGQMFSVTIQRIEPRQIVVELGRAEGIIPLTEQSQSERFRVGQRMKVILQSVRTSLKGPEVILSRIDKLLVQRLFETEVPEVQAGSVEILSIAREAGSRSKVAVWAKQEGIDAVGSCVGLRGIRIQNIVNELQGEKIDVIGWDSDPAKYISNALSPSDVGRVEMYQDDLSATAIVPQKQLSLAIGKEGQNARLAARLTGWKIDIKSHEEAMEQAGGELPNLIKDASKVVEESPVSSVDSLQQESADQIKQQEVKEKPVFDKSIFEEEAKTKEEEIDVSDVGIKASEQSVEELAKLSEDELAGITNTKVNESEETESTAKPDLVAELPQDIWDISKTKSSNAGGLRFAEDIDELRRGTGTTKKRTKRKVIKNSRKK